jgi:hypothetical protein
VVLDEGGYDRWRDLGVVDLSKVDGVATDLRQVIGESCRRGGDVTLERLDAVSDKGVGAGGPCGREGGRKYRLIGGKGEAGKATQGREMAV